MSTRKTQTRTLLRKARISHRIKMQCDKKCEVEKNLFEIISGRKIRRKFSFGSENRICRNTWLGKRKKLSEKFEVALAVLRYRGCIRGRIDGGDLLFGDVSKRSNAPRL